MTIARSSTVHPNAEVRENKPPISPECQHSTAQITLGDAFCGPEKVAQVFIGSKVRLAPHGEFPIPFPQDALKVNQSILFANQECTLEELARVAERHRIKLTLNMSTTMEQTLKAENAQRGWHLVFTKPTQTPSVKSDRSGKWGSLNILDALQLVLVCQILGQPALHRSCFFFVRNLGSPRVFFYLDATGDEVIVSDPRYQVSGDEVGMTLQAVFPPPEWTTEFKTAVAA